MVNFYEFDRMIAAARMVAQVKMEMLFATVSRARCTEHVHSCGTAGCLIGTYLAAYPEICPEIDSNWCGWEDIRAILGSLLGTTDDEFEWLFHIGPMLMSFEEYEDYMYECDDRPGTFDSSCVYRFERELEHVTTAEAIGRLCKYVDYKKRKSMLFTAWNERQHRRGMQCRAEGLILAG